MEKICDLLESVQMTVIGGVFLMLSLILAHFDIAPFIDPAWAAVIISGVPILCSAVKKLIKNKGINKISSSLLISTAMIAAILIDDLFAAGEVAFIMAIGEILEDKTTEKAKKGLKKLISLAPVQGRRIVSGEEKIIPAEEIKTGDIIRILPGETVPVDGEIISGETSIDQSVMTGESLPVDKTVGDSVFSGTVNRFGSVDIRASKVGSDSSLAKLIRMVKEAEKNQAPMQRTADKWASYLVPTAMLIAIIAFFVTKDIVRAVTVLVVFCPCAMVLATPTAIMAAIGQATRHGIIIKSGEALEKMGRVKVVTFDKTGTLTKGKLTVSDVLPVGMSKEELLSAAASAESKSEHPIGTAIASYAKKEGIEIFEPSKFSMEAGKGVLAVINDCEILCGSESFITEKNIALSEKNVLNNLREQGKASVIVAVNGVFCGIIALSDVLREESKEVISELKKIGTRSALLTGDNEKAAKYFADKIGIGDVYSELLPAQKVDIIKKIQKESAVCMIGDGVNDAPALKTADVGIAMGGDGCDIAVEAADIALMSDDISKIPYLKRLSAGTLKTIKFSITLSLLINFAAIILSLLGLLTPTTGALVHNLGSCFVVLIAAGLYERKF